MNDRPNLKQFAEQTAGHTLATHSTESIEAELQKRKLRKPFPLDVFHDNIKPYINALVNEYDLPRAYVGLAMLSAYSSAIGTAYHVHMNKLGDIYLPIWACLEGISSGGKSLVMSQVYKPHFEIQREWNEEWENATEGKTDFEKETTPIKQLIYRDSYIPTLVRWIMPHNPKGLSKDADEILEWVNGMNSLTKKEGIDEQFWLSTWDCKQYEAIRSGNKKFTIPKPFLNVFGGIQPSVMWKLFKNDRATTGFIFRLLFAVPEKIKISEPNLLYDMPEEYENIHAKCINSLVNGLPVNDVFEDSRQVIITPEALKRYQEWAKQRNSYINHMPDVHDREIHSGIMGKIKTYCLRFVGILHVADLAYNHKTFQLQEIADSRTMERAIKLADYFYEAAADVADRVNAVVVAPPEVIRYASYLKAGFSYAKIGETEWPNEKPAARKSKATRMVKKYIKQYPKVFNAER